MSQRISPQMSRTLRHPKADDVALTRVNRLTGLLGMIEGEITRRQQKTGCRCRPGYPCHDLSDPCFCGLNAAAQP